MGGQRRAERLLQAPVGWRGSLPREGVGLFLGLPTAHLTWNLVQLPHPPRDHELLWVYCLHRACQTLQSPAGGPTEVPPANSTDRQGTPGPQYHSSPGLPALGVLSGNLLQPPRPPLQPLTSAPSGYSDLFSLNPHPWPQSPHL